MPGLRFVSLYTADADCCLTDTDILKSDNDAKMNCVRSGGDLNLKLQV